MGLIPVRTVGIVSGFSQMIELALADRKLIASVKRRIHGGVFGLFLAHGKSKKMG